MDRAAFGIGIDLVVDVGELQIELVLGHIADMRCGDHARVADDRIVRIGERFGLEHIEGDGARSARRRGPSPGLLAPPERLSMR